jgi:hypothetical protein
MGRRIPSFPVRFELFKPTRFSKEESVMYFAHEWDAYQKSLHHDDQPTAAAPVSPATTAASLIPDINQATAQNSAAPATPAPAPISCELSRLVSISPTPSVPSSAALVPPDFSRHSRRCCICLHPDRDAIEGDFIRWRSPELIAREYNLANRTSIYRHAHCTGLFAWRRRELGRVLEGMLENHEHIPLEASDAIIRAARVYAHLDENGNWFEPARTNFVFTSPVTALHPLESSMPTNSGRAKRRSKKKPLAAVKSNSNIRITGKRSSK